MRPKKIKENKPFKISVRLTDKQYSYIMRLSKNLCISPSDYVRMLINFKLIESEGIKNHEDFKSNFYNQL